MSDDPRLLDPKFIAGVKLINRTGARSFRIGFTPEEATLLKSGLGEVPAINTALDATSFLKRFWGAVI